MLEVFPVYTGNVSILYWKCFEFILEALELEVVPGYTGNAPRLDWKCFQFVLEM